MKKSALAFTAMMTVSAPALAQDSEITLRDYLANGYTIADTEVVTSDVIAGGEGPNVLLLTLQKETAIAICSVDVGLTVNAAQLADVATCTTSE